jgi:hypothetical protein
MRLSTLLNFKIINLNEASVLSNDGVVVFIDRHEMFKTPDDIMDRYHDILRRYGTKPNAKKFAVQGSHFDSNYRRHIMKDSMRMMELKKLCDVATVKTVYLVQEDGVSASILIDIAKWMVGAGRWRINVPNMETMI